MALTLVVHLGEARDPEGAGAGAKPGAQKRELSLTLDSPRVVIGRGDGCDLRLPDPSVSHRHASIRQKGGEYQLMDEGSTNGTFVGRVRLPSQTPHAMKTGDVFRIGRVFVEVRITPVLVKGSTAAAAKELALELVERGLVEQGEEPWPRVSVVDGEEVGRELVLKEFTRDYVLGKSRDADLELEGDAARRHVILRRRAEGIAVLAAGTTDASIDGVPVGERSESIWRTHQELSVGPRRLTFHYPTFDALLEIERGPDERMRGDEQPEPPSRELPTPTPAPAEPSASAADHAPEAASPAPLGTRRESAKKAEAGGWSAVDGLVILLALAVLLASISGAWWIFGR